MYHVYQEVLGVSNVSDVYNVYQMYISNEAFVKFYRCVGWTLILSFSQIIKYVCYGFNYYNLFCHLCKCPYILYNKR